MASVSNLVFLLVSFGLKYFVSAQVSWTPIYVDGNSQVDLWTQKASGCPCPYDTSQKDSCACCVQDGGCHCGEDSPHRCSQCGIQQYCTAMCNITLDARSLLTTSNKTFGQIKSPSIQGPAFCWYSLQPDTGQRVEIQIYRLVSVGRFNGTNCEAGFVQLVEGEKATPRAADTQICGGNERFTPPVVLFGDKGPATLIFQITEPTIRSQFLAYFSFTPINSSLGVGFQPHGGKRVEHTDCDWLYQDFMCNSPGLCKLASPGYPGIYPPRRKCRYHIKISSMHTWVKIRFLALFLPHNHCNTDHIKIYQGPTTASPLVATLCGNRKQELTYPGPNLLLEFSSGSSLPPFDYNGFLASLEFWEKPVTTEATTTSSTSRVTEVGILSKSMDGNNWHTTVRPSCEIIFAGNETRSGHFDSRNLEWNQNCTFTFIGKQNDVVHISLFNYKLKSTSCQSVIEVFDGFVIERHKPLKKICSPSIKHARDPSGKFHEHQTFVSSGNFLSLFFRRFAALSSQPDQEFLDGAYVFHDEHVGGTLQPDTLCNVDYYGMSAASRGTIHNSGNQHVFWNVEGPLECVHRFIPAANQSIVVQVMSLNKNRSESQCHTLCGDSGCQCMTPSLPLSQFDHLKFVTDSGLLLSCICGGFEEEWLPVGIRSWSSIKIVYSLAHYSWTMKGYSFQADYNFKTDDVCGNHVINQHSGVIDSKSLDDKEQLNYFFHQSCTWLLDSNVERNLNVEITSNQNRACSAWNLSLHEYSELNPERTGAHLHTFCSRDGYKNYSLPWKLNILVIKLSAMTRRPPQFHIKWRSQIVRANTRTAGPVQEMASHASSSCTHTLFQLVFLLLINNLTHR